MSTTENGPVTWETLRAAYVAQHRDPYIHWDGDVLEAQCTMCGLRVTCDAESERRAMNERGGAYQDWAEPAHWLALDKHLAKAHPGEILPSHRAGAEFDAFRVRQASSVSELAWRAGYRAGTDDALRRWAQ